MDTTLTIYLTVCLVSIFVTGLYFGYQIGLRRAKFKGTIKGKSNIKRIK